MFAVEQFIPEELDLAVSISAESVQTLRKALLHWYDEEHRPLPWRNRPSEYGTVVSEFMLQQTQVTTVIPFYEAFLKQFPTWKKLAAATEEDVLHAWSGLGYYRRARMLKRVAETVVRDCRGRLPRDPEHLAALPGFGAYTVGAVGSIALGLRLPLVDGNVRRVISRLFAIEGDLLSGAAKRRLWAICRDLVDPQRPGDFNQSLMELGATVCLPREPLCLICPAFDQCHARQEGFPEAYPAPIIHPKLLHVREVAVALLRGNKVLVLQRGEQGAFAGMWEFPRLDNRHAIKILKTTKGKNQESPANNGRNPNSETEQNGELSPAQVLFDQLRLRAGKRADFLGTTEATFTHHRIKTDLYRVQDRSVGAVRRQSHVSHKWIAIKNLSQLPASTAQRRLFELLAQKTK